jgi:hypothetical protein
MPAINRHYVHAAANTYVESIVVSGKTITLVGPPTAIIHFNNNGDALGVSSGGSLTVRGLTVTSNDGAGKGGNGGNCNAASFTAYQTQFVGNLQSGISSNNCALLVDGCWLNGNGGAGIYIVAGDFQIYNSILTHNANNGGFYQFGGGTTTLFVNNTVGDNTAGAVAGGVYCYVGSSLTVKNSILYNNKAAGTVAETSPGCAVSGNASDDPAGGPTSTVDLTGQAPGFKATLPLAADSYHLLSTSVCIDKVSKTGAPDHDYDLQSRPDSADSMIDIGADEAY